MARSDYTISPYGRADCPVCGGEFSLTKKGVMRHHANSGERQLDYRAPVCKGVGMAPEAATDA